MRRDSHGADDNPAELSLKDALSPVAASDVSDRALRRLDTLTQEKEAADAGPETQLKDLSAPKHDSERLRRTLTGIEPRRRRLSLLAAIENKKLAVAGLATFALIMLVGLLSTVWGPEGLTTGLDGHALAVRTIEGKVLLTRAGDPRPLTEDIELRSQDVLATSANSFLELGVGGSAKIMLEPHSRVNVAHVDDSAVRFELLRGRAACEIETSSQSPELQFSVGSELFSLKGGTIGLVRAAPQRFVLAAVDTAELIIGERGFSLSGGHGVQIQRGVVGPSRPVDEDVWVKLRPGRLASQNSKRLRVAGQTSPDVFLVINDTPVPVNEHGKFSSMVPVNRKTRSVKAVAVNALGASATREMDVGRGPSKSRR